MYKLILAILSLFSWGMYSQDNIKLLTFEALEKQMKIQSKPVVVFFHTSWCGYCALMEEKTFQDKAVVQLMNEHFYFVSFNAETKEDQTFRGRVFSYKPTSLRTGTHEIVTALGKYNTYPAVIFLNKELEIVYQHFAYLRPKDMQKILKVVLDNNQVD